MLSCMGVIHHMLGHRAEGFNFNTRALAVLTEIMGDDSRWTTKAKYRLACDHRSHGDYGVAW